MTSYAQEDPSTPQPPDPGAYLSRRSLMSVLGALGLAGPGAALAQDASKVNPRSYRVVLENDKVRVLEYRSLPGMPVCGQGIHSHPAHLTIALTGGRVKATGSDGQTAALDSPAGAIFWAPAETHAVENISGHAMRAYMVEIKDKDWKASTG